MQKSDLLAIQAMTMRFGGLTVIDELNFSVREGELLGLIGPNGAGKTTVFNVITGVYAPTAGQVRFGGQEIAGLAPYQIARLGMTRTFQNIRLFKDLPCLDNVLLSLHQHCEYGLVDSVLRTRRYHAQEAEFRDLSLRLLELFGLTKWQDFAAGSLPYGEQRKLEIVRCLASKPKLILLDEPAAGMNPSEKENLMRLIRRIRDEFHLTVVLIEHDMRLVMGVCERILVLDHGCLIAEGGPSQIQKDPKVIEAYLGVEASG